MKPITIKAIQAGLPKSSMRATTSDMAFSPPGSPAHVNVYNIYMTRPGAFVKRGRGGIFDGSRIWLHAVEMGVGGGNGKRGHGAVRVRGPAANAREEDAPTHCAGRRARLTRLIPSRERARRPWMPTRS